MNFIICSAINTFLIAPFFFPKSFESAGGIKCDTQNGHSTEAKFITTALGHNSKALQNNADPYHLQD